ncbi:MAG TPA: DNA topoisomerase VI subunit B [Phycisphaerae bacterium]|nr:DNA topoisomerase VI subunit B [Phycisphaerae bacterium]HPS52512.1 DNA topoisomerase VI subunit B [Phycisphaerae bacterium]
MAKKAPNTKTSKKDATGFLFDDNQVTAESSTVAEKPAKAKRISKKTPPSNPQLPEETEEHSPVTKRKSAKQKYATAESMAKAQRSISVSEFFAKNRHLLGFDNPRKALLTTVKEAVDNSLDACEEAGIMPLVEVAIDQISETHFRVMVQDNGPGIVRQQIPNIFGRLLYGSKFHRLRMSRGQQGIGISAAGMYGLLTTGKPVKIISRTGKRSPAHSYTLKIDTRNNKPEILADEIVDWAPEHGTCVEIELEARYQKGRQSVDEYLQQTAVANPHVTFKYKTPDGRDISYTASVMELPAIPKEIKPHPHGVELGVFIKMLQDTTAKNLQQFFTSEFSRISPKLADEIIKKAGMGLTPKTRPAGVDGDKARALHVAINDVKILAPNTDCIVPIGHEQLIAGLKQVVDAEFYAAISRKPAVYRGNPFVIEAAIAYGKNPACQSQQQQTLLDETENDDDNDDATSADDDNGGDSLARVLRLANRVPLQYQQGACAIYKSVAQMSWRKYGLSQSRGALPAGDLTIVIHMGSVWVPFTSESKEAIASYPDILKEIRLALQECGRKLGAHIRKTSRIRQELKKRSYIEKYIPAIGQALKDILNLKDRQVEKVCDELKDILEKSRKM